MKTLGEVIEACEKCYGKYIDCDDCQYTVVNEVGVTICAKDQLEDDALHYLKEYQERLSQLQDMMDRYDINNRNYQEAVQNCEMVQLKYQQLLDDYNDNPPLTWDELRQMEGRPVWIEWLNHDIWSDPNHRESGGWWIVGEVRPNDIIIAQYLDEAELCEEDLDEVWQAYRKERK